jgi:PleD family two-component response regulator
LTAETAGRVDIAAMNAGALDYLVKGEITPRMIERSIRYALKLGDTLEALRRLATRDQRTGLLNRREFERILDRGGGARAAFRPLARPRDGGHRSFQVSQRHARPSGG